MTCTEGERIPDSPNKLQWVQMDGELMYEAPREPFTCAGNPPFGFTRPSDNAVQHLRKVAPPESEGRVQWDYKCMRSALPTLFENDKIPSFTVDRTHLQRLSEDGEYTYAVSTQFYALRLIILIEHGLNIGQPVGYPFWIGPRSLGADLTQAKAPGEGLGYRTPVSSIGNVFPVQTSMLIFSPVCLPMTVPRTLIMKRDEPNPEIGRQLGVALRTLEKRGAVDLGPLAAAYRIYRGESVSSMSEEDSAEFILWLFHNMDPQALGQTAETPKKSVPNPRRVAATKTGDQFVYDSMWRQRTIAANEAMWRAGRQMFGQHSQQPKVSKRLGAD
ncbi:uncharacterized protein EV422DRAFT_299505 [Fimicolochytrium jonesii]|uniref:uncharacterized protein n=1 Tax=Fimicolochytrium jonesii TaxID=1396493 RepID=UPI0022FEF414|nr:uncharacterized protein EV422DRAFT_299505 [Fimicolochytrium jonesii]KAI8816236.1 hypothetical protein EV422DRAFT_299505 [Fimicolochytrium jonesii]